MSATDHGPAANERVAGPAAGRWPVGRAYEASDLDRVCALLAACLAAGETQGSLTVSELRQVLPRPMIDAPRNARLWETASGELVGFAWAWAWTPPRVAPRPANVEVLVHPTHPACAGEAWDALAKALVAWVLGRAREIAHEEGVPVTLRAPVDERRQRLIEAFRASGLALEQGHHLRYARRLDDPAAPIPPPSLPSTPEGFTLRALRGEEEVEAYCALKTEAFGMRPPWTADEQMAAMRDPDYCAELDLVAVAPSGELAALVIGGIDREEGARCGEVVGYTDPLATRPAYRRLGLARALLYEAFGRLRARGAVETRVGTQSSNTATQRLLESVGYRLSHRRLVFGMEVAPGSARTGQGASA